MPTGASSAVEISLFTNPTPDGVQLGDDCPVNCFEAEPVKSAWYPINDGENRCYQWEGESGHNSMNYGTCNPKANSFTYSHWTADCECSGEPGAVKTVYTERCVVDEPTVCQMVTDYSACVSQFM